MKNLNNCRAGAERLVLCIFAAAAMATGCEKEENAYAPPPEYPVIVGDYELFWSEEFDYEGLPADNIWVYEEGYMRNNEQQDYKVANTTYSRVEDGKLILEAHEDAHTLVKDGKDPMRQSLVPHIRPSAENAEVISEFFPDVSAEQMRKALEDMIRYNGLLVCPGRLKRWMVVRALRKSGNYDDMIGLVLNAEGDPGCDDSNKRLTELYDESVELSVELIRDLHAYLVGRKDILCARFDRTFGVE